MGPHPDAAGTGGAAARTPRTDGYRMPAEFAPHERCLIAWPTRSRAYWGEHYMLAQHSYAAVARAIARYEPVLVIARPGEGPEATSYCGTDGIEVVEMPLDDSWIRDSGPIFVQRPDGDTAVADFAFNSWGERYLPYDDDARIGERLAEHFGVQAVRDADDPGGRIDHGGRRRDPHHDRELPAAPVAQPGADEGRDRAGPQGLPRRREGDLARLGPRPRGGPRHRRARRRGRGVHRPGAGPASHGARPAPPGLRQPAGEPTPARDDRRSRQAARRRRARPARRARAASAAATSSRPTSTSTRRTAP